MYRVIIEESSILIRDSEVGAKAKAERLDLSLKPGLNESRKLERGCCQLSETEKDSQSKKFTPKLPENLFIQECVLTGFQATAFVSLQ